MKHIRFKPDCREWIKRGVKTTTFRKTKRNGIYEIVEGSWYHPRRLGIFIKCTPIKHTTSEDVVFNHYMTEGDFKDPIEFLAWLRRNNLELPDEGWLNRVEFLAEETRRQLK